MPVSLARTLDLRNLHTDETWSGTYHDGTRYIPEAMTALNHLLRDRRSGDVATMDPGVIDILFRIQQRLHEEGQDAGVLGIICGYRSPTTNARMASQDDGVAVHSMHPQAKAIDIQHSVLPARSIQQIALNLQSSEQCGGVGYYPQSNFVHVDTGRVRRWNG